MICVVYVDDLIFWSQEVPRINQKEDNAAGFLGVTLDRDASTGILEMKQTGLIKQVIKALGLDDGYAKGKHTPAQNQGLGERCRWGSSTWRI